jgi:hypothetical protein
MSRLKIEIPKAWSPDGYPITDANVQWKAICDFAASKGLSDEAIHDLDVMTRFVSDEDEQRFDAWLEVLIFTRKLQKEAERNDPHSIAHFLDGPGPMLKLGKPGPDTFFPSISAEHLTKDQWSKVRATSKGPGLEGSKEQIVSLLERGEYLLIDWGDLGVRQIAIVFAHRLLPPDHSSEQFDKFADNIVKKARLALVERRNRQIREAV